MRGVTRRPLAVALQYDAPNVPKVVAMGRGELGQRIIDLAKEHEIPLEENPVLAEALSTVEVEEEIPEALYLAVAEVLAFLLRQGKIEN